MMRDKAKVGDLPFILRIEYSLNTWSSSDGWKELISTLKGKANSGTLSGMMPDVRAVRKQEGSVLDHFILKRILDVMTVY